MWSGWQGIVMADRVLCVVWEVVIHFQFVLRFLSSPSFVARVLRAFSWSRANLSPEIETLENRPKPVFTP